MKVPGKWHSNRVPSPDLRERVRGVLKLGLPIIGGMASQNVLNLVDTAMVGQLGSPALAAVGLASMAVFVASAFFTAFGNGVQAIAARRMGQKDARGAIVAVHAALVVIVAVVLPYSLLLSTQATPIFDLLTTDPAIKSEGIPYLRIRLCAIALVSANFSFRGYWNGIGLSTVYLRTIVTIHVVNIVLNWVLIYGNLGFPAMGVTGAGLASAIAVGIGTLTYVLLGLKLTRKDGFMTRGTITWGTTKNVLRLSVPPGIQNLFMACGYLAFYRIAELLGTRELAATNVLVNLALVCILPAMGFGIASATLVGNALGAEKPEEATRWGWTTVGVAAALLGVVGLILAVFPSTWLGLIMNDPPAEAMAVVPLVLLGLTQPIDSIGVVLSQALIGAGAVRSVMVAGVILQWGIFLPLCYLWGYLAEGGLLSLWVSMAFYRGLQAIWMAVLFQRGKWTTIEV